MGRRKKEIEISDVGKIKNQSQSILFNNLNFPTETNEEKNKKKCEKLIVKIYKQKIQIDVDELYMKLHERFLNEDEVKNIISEFKMKIKDLEYLFRKQWQVLKRFNLQENIYRVESKNLTESEKLKKDEIYKETIEKLTATHVAGFEPALVIKNKILSKIQQKFFHSDQVMNEFKNINFDSHFSKDAKENKTEFISEEKLLKQRYEDQVGVLEKFIQDKFITPGKDNKYKDRDREYDSIHNYQQNKQELKRYEKELEHKAGKGGFYSSIIDESNENELILNYEIPITAIKKQGKLEKDKSSSIFENSISSKSNLIVNDDITNDSMIIDYEMNNEIKMTPDDSFSNKYDNNIKFKEILKNCDTDVISKFKDKIIDDMREKVLFNKDFYEGALKTQNYQYKSKILNDLFLKLTYFGKLTDNEIQIIIFLSHVVVRDLVHAKLNNRIYEGIVNPEELLDFLKRFKIEIQNNGEVFVNGKPISSRNNQDQNLNSNLFRGNQSSYSYLHSEYSMDDL